MHKIENIFGLHDGSSLKLDWNMILTLCYAICDHITSLKLCLLLLLVIKRPGVLRMCFVNGLCGFI